ncbi:MAG: hypothetical protein Q9202_001905 [Teloschistes flavicans]
MISQLVATGTLLISVYLLAQYRAFRRNLQEAKNFSLFGHVWHEGYRPFRILGYDTFIAVTPKGNILWTCDPEVIMQLSNRRRDFVKPVEMMEMLNMFGPTITATDGEESRTYRKIITPSFNENTHQAVWEESIKQAQAMTTTWMKRGRTVIHTDEDLARLTLNVISDVCFARNLDWKDLRSLQDPTPLGHKMGYRASISSILTNTGVLMMTPPPILKFSPLQIHKKAKLAYQEWLHYMQEMKEEASHKLSKAPNSASMNLLETLVQAGQPPHPSISSSAVLGNIFMTITAGHETSANTLTYALVLLACRPAIQQELQSHLDKVVGNQPPEKWSYKDNFAPLLEGYTGAIMSEVLRLYSVLPFIPKKTESVPQSLTLNEKTYIVPPNTLCMMNTSAVHRHPKFWPQCELIADDGPPYPVSSFDPSIWLRDTKEDIGDQAADTFFPRPGSFIPFSEGPRACIGKRFAQAQFVAVIAVIFRNYSVELAVGTDEKEKTKPQGQGSEELRARWEKERRHAEYELSTGVSFLLSLKMSGNVPLRIVPRGGETWPRAR